MAGAMQFEAGVSTIGKTRGAGIVAGIPLVAHGFNNIYEGLGNIYNSPGAPSIVFIKKVLEALTKATWPTTPWICTYL